MDAIGNVEDATMAAVIASYCEFYTDKYWNDSIAPPVDIPDEWHVLGCGSTRIAILSPAGVVYKVAVSLYEQRQQAWEYENSHKIKVPANSHWRLARCNLIETDFGPVIAMELVGRNVFECNIPDSVIDDICVYLNRYNIRDSHHDNMRVDDNGMIVVIDYSR